MKKVLECKCLLCGKDHIKRMCNHLILHKMKVEDYLNLYPDAEISCISSFKGHIQSKEAKLIISRSRLGKTSWSKGLTKETNESVRKISLKMKDNKNSLGVKRKPETGLKISLANTGKIRSKETIKILSDSHIGQISLKKDKSFVELYGEEKALKIRKNLSKSIKLKWQDPIYRENQRIKHIISMTLRWQNPEFREKNIKAVLKGLFKRPTSFEKKLIDLSIKYNIPLIYIGDGKEIVGYVNPDFKDTLKLGIYIEIFFSYFKIKDYGSVNHYEEVRPKNMCVDPSRILFLDETDLERKDWEMHCLCKIFGLLLFGALIKKDYVLYDNVEKQVMEIFKNVDI